MANTENSLKKDLGLISSMAMVVGMVIGSGVYVKPGIVFGQAGDSFNGLMAWFLGGVITIAAGLTLSELGVLFPKTGGLYIYINEIYGKMSSFLFGWMQTLIYGPAIIGALGAYFGSLMVVSLDEYFGFGESASIPIGIITIVFLAGANSIGTKYGGIIQSVSTVAKLIPIFVIAIFGILHGKGGSPLGASAGIKESAGMGAAILATLWAYDGWAGVSFMAGEMKNPAKILPRAIIGGLAIVALAYVSINYALLQVLPVPEIVKYGKEASGQAAELLFGGLGGRLINVGILISIFGALNGNILALPRVPYAMACRRQLPGAGLFSQVHSRFGTPIYATTLQSVIAIILMIIPGVSADRLTDWAMFSILIFYTLCFIGVFIARSKFANLERTYKVPLYPIVPLIAIVGSVYILYSTLMGSWLDCTISLGITATGIPIFYLLGDTSKK